MPTGTIGNTRHIIICRGDQDAGTGNQGIYEYCGYHGAVGYAAGTALRAYGMRSETVKFDHAESEPEYSVKRYAAWLRYHVLGIL